jgi:hypothetical protein
MVFLFSKFFLIGLISISTPALADHCDSPSLVKKNDQLRNANTAASNKVFNYKGERWVWVRENGKPKLKYPNEYCKLLKQKLHHEIVF